MDEVNELQASQSQKRMFFALCNQLGLEAEKAKDAVKRKFKIDSFADISKAQLSEVIDMLDKKVQTKTKQALVAFFETNNPRLFFGKEIGQEFKTYEEFLANETLKYFMVRERQ
jgi:hypothetical protein